MIAATVIGIASIIAVAIGAVTSADTGNPYSSSDSSGQSYTATDTPVPTDTPGRVLLQDSLTTNTNNWDAGEGCSFSNGGYQITGPGSIAGWICWSSGATAIVGDGVITVQARQIAGNTTYGFGIMLRGGSRTGNDFNRDLNVYEFHIDADGNWGYGRWVAGSWTDIVPWTRASAIHTGLNAVNTLSVRAQSGHFDFYVNGLRLGTAEDVTYASGPIGFFVGFSYMVVVVTVQAGAG